MVSYITFLIIFTLGFQELEMETDGDSEKLPHVGNFTQMFLETFRSAIGEVGLPKYTQLLKHPDSFIRNLDQALIWIMWFFQVFFMLVIMLNFLIAVLTETY